MTTCKQCGMQVQTSAGLTTCPNCGEPLNGVSDGGRGALNARAGVQDSAALPAWLESLRAHERPRPSPGAPQNFSTADLIDEDALPGWMRPQNGNADDAGYPSFGQPGRPASFPAPNTDSGVLPVPPGGLSASSLIDSSALPTWMQGDQPAGAPGSSSASQEAPEPFSASSLIDPNSLPAWMTGQQPERPPVPPLPSQQGMPAYPQGVPPMPAPAAPQNPAAVWGNAEPPRMFSAGELIDEQSLPSWMPGQAQGAPQSQGFPPAQPPQGSGQAGQGMSAIDNTPPVSNEAGGDPSRLSAASLLDMEALPGWLREEEQGQAGQAAPGGGMLSAGSLLDSNSLPDWLRDAEHQSPAGSAPPNLQLPAPYGAPRAESVRVPSRPRAEIVPQEQSEVAASVFSSMLGVASTTPFYPQAGTPQQGFQGNPPPAVPLYTMPGMPGGEEPPSSAQPASPAFPGANTGIPPAQPGNPQSGYLGGSGAMQPGYGPPPPAPPPPAQGSGATPGMVTAAQRSAVTMPGTRAKRGFMDFIRDLFHINS